MRRWISSAAAGSGPHRLKRNWHGHLMLETSHSRCTPTELKADCVIKLEAVPVNGRGSDLAFSGLKFASVLTASLVSAVKVGSNKISWARQSPTR